MVGVEVGADDASPDHRPNANARGVILADDFILFVSCEL
jgi:hypothetical protein